MSESTIDTDDYPMDDEGWIKCHHCNGSGLGVDGLDCDFCDGTGELERGAKLR